MFCLAGILTNALFFGPALRHTLRADNDFLGLYPGGKLAGSAAVYDCNRVQEVQRQVTGSANPQLVFCRPPFYAAILWPLARLPYRGAYLIFQVLMLAAAATFAASFPLASRRATIMACCWSFPLFENFAISQDLPILLCAISFSIILLRNGKDLLAGLIFCACAIKPHLFFALPVFVAARGRWRFAAGLFCGGLLLLALSFAGAGTNWLGAFLHAATLPQANPGLSVMPNLNGLFQGNHAGELAASAIVLAAVWYVSRRGNPGWAFAATLTAGLLTSHHAYTADCALLLPPLLIAFSTATLRWHKYLTLVLLTPPLFVIGSLGSSMLVLRLALVVFFAGFVFSNPKSQSLSNAEPRALRF
jgi:hypothetical protein